MKNRFKVLPVIFILSVLLLGTSCEKDVGILEEPNANRYENSTTAQNLTGQDAPKSALRFIGPTEILNNVKPGRRYKYRIDFGSYGVTPCEWTVRISAGSEPLKIPGNSSSASVYAYYNPYLVDGRNETSFVEVNCPEIGQGTWLAVTLKDGYVLINAKEPLPF